MAVKVGLDKPGCLRGGRLHGGCRRELCLDIPFGDGSCGDRCFENGHGGRSSGGNGGGRGGESGGGRGGGGD